MRAIQEEISLKAQQSIYQYLLDHSEIQENGYFGILLYFLNQDDFWRRVQARHSGFKRYDIGKKNQIAETKRTDWTTLNYMKRLAERNGKISERIDKHGSLKEKLLLWIYRKTRNKIFKNGIRNNKTR